MIRQLLQKPEEDLHEQTYTLTVMYDDVLDAEQALAQLRRGKQTPTIVSVILRERVLEENPQAPYRAVLSTVIEQSSLEAAAKWLRGLVNIVLPDRANFLAAGPIGMILSTIRDAGLTTAEEHEQIIVRAERSHQIAQTMQAFGFAKDESLYVEQRVVGGSPLIAATSDQVNELREIHDILTANMPVYVGLARTDAHIAERAAILVERGPRTAGTALIADAMSPLRSVRHTPDLQRTTRDQRGLVVRSQYGEIVGRVADLLYEPYPSGKPEGDHDGLSDGEMLLRYVVVRMSTLVGMKRPRVAFPGDRVRVTRDGIVLLITHEEMDRAPRITGSTTLSRQEEAAIRRHFDSPLYWITEAESGQEAGSS